MKYILEMDEEQAILTRKALEFYARIIIGQWNMIGELCLDIHDKEYAEKKAELDEGMYALRRIVYPDLPTGASYGVTSKEKSCLVWEICQVLRHRLAWTRSPKGGWKVEFDKPISFSGHELPKCWAKEI